ncbi:PEP-CTERM sorting domain-containing protein [Kiritimatiellaeota bacterium B1221]|nr:PEP-CTERM sorting domain-containing protein [Kiritimatiellaeota bacterium B1221]
MNNKSKMSSGLWMCAGIALSCQAAVVRIDSMTPASSASSRLTEDSIVTQLTLGSQTVTQLVGPTTVTGGSSGEAKFRGADETYSYPSLAGALQGMNITTAAANAGTFQAFFGQTITDIDDGGVLADVFIAEIGTPTQSGDPFTVRAILSGTPGGTLIYGPTVASVSGYAGKEDAVAYTSLDRSGSSGSAFDVRGFGLDLSDDLGVTSLIGLEIGAGSVSDPNVILATIIPEPGSLFLVLSAVSGLILLTLRKRRE